MREKLIKIISQNLSKNIDNLKDQYTKNQKEFGIGFCYLDNVLPEEIVFEIYNAFPKAGQPWREMSSFRERKLTTKQFDKVPEILGDATFAIQSDEVLAISEKITGIENLKGDPTLYAGGLSAMRNGDFLNPHIDNSHDQDRKVYRRLNALFYVTPDWKVQDGGNLELWDPKVEKPVQIDSKFNRLVIMETHSLSWHSVTKVSNSEKMRCCVSNYYFSEESPTGEDYYHVTSFAGRPEEKVKRIASKLDNNLRALVRNVIKSGLGKKDQFKQESK